MWAHIVDCDLIRTYSGHDLNISNYINLILILNVFLINMLKTKTYWMWSQVLYSSPVSYNKMSLCVGWWLLAIEKAKPFCGIEYEKMPTRLKYWILFGIRYVWIYIDLVYHVISFVVNVSLLLPATSYDIKIL